MALCLSHKDTVQPDLDNLNFDSLFSSGDDSLLSSQHFKSSLEDVFHLETVETMPPSMWSDLCVMTPPKRRATSDVAWTPTANLKILLKAASPDIRSRELVQQSDNKLVASKINGPQNRKFAKQKQDHSSNGDTDLSEIGDLTLNSSDTGKRKEKSLGLLCCRYVM